MLGMALPKSRVPLHSFPSQGSPDPCISLLLFPCGWTILTFVSKCKYLPPTQEPNTNTMITQCLGHSPSNRDKNQHIQGTRKKRQCKSESANVSNMLVRQAFLNAPPGCSRCKVTALITWKTSPQLPSWCEGPHPFAGGPLNFHTAFGKVLM